MNLINFHRFIRCATAVLTVTLAACGGPTNDTVVTSQPLFEGTGPHHRSVSTTSEEAQAYFDQGLAFLYAFNHDEAIRMFRSAAEADPNFAMAHWGIAYANGPHINNSAVPPAREDEAFEDSREALGWPNCSTTWPTAL